MCILGLNNTIYYNLVTFIIDLAPPVKINRVWEPHLKSNRQMWRQLSGLEGIPIITLTVCYHYADIVPIALFRCSRVILLRSYYCRRANIVFVMLQENSVGFFKVQSLYSTVV